MRWNSPPQPTKFLARTGIARLNRSFARKFADNTNGLCPPSTASALLFRTSGGDSRPRRRIRCCSPSERERISVSTGRLRVREIKSMLQQLNIHHSDCFEKSELVERLTEALLPIASVPLRKALQRTSRASDLDTHIHKMLYYLCILI